MSCQVESHTKSPSNDKSRLIMQRLKQEEELSISEECASLNDIPLVKRRKAAKEPLYLTRYE